MVASRDIKPGEVIFREEPLTFGPSDNSKPVCLGCYKRIVRIIILNFACSLIKARLKILLQLDKNCYTCKSCGFPMCNKKCSQIAEHKDFECAALLNKGFKVDATTLKYVTTLVFYTFFHIFKPYFLATRAKSPLIALCLQ